MYLFFVILLVTVKHFIICMSFVKQSLSIVHAHLFNWFILHIMISDN